MKKKLIYGLVFVMSVATLGGCGSKKGEKVEVTLQEILTNAADKLVSIDSIEFDVNGSLDGMMEKDEQKIEAKGSASLEGTATTEDPSAYLSGKLDYECSYNNTNLSGKHSVEMYGEDNADENLFYTYIKLDDGEWSGSKQDIAEFTESLGELDVEELKEELESIKEDENFNKVFKLKDTVQTANGKECYMIYADIDKDDLIEIVKAESEQDAEDLEAIDSLNVSFEIYFDKETYYPVKLAVDIDLKADIEESNMKLDIKDFKIEVNSDINKAKTVTVPEEVKENVTFEDEIEQSI